jgi:hypothetical protein
MREKHRAILMLAIVSFALPMGEWLMLMYAGEVAGRAVAL